MPFSDPSSLKAIAVAIFNGGVIYGGLKAGQRKYLERQARQGRAITRLLQYKAWSHRAVTVLMQYHKIHHPGEVGIEDWKEIEEGLNGGNNGDS